MMKFKFINPIPKSIKIFFLAQNWLFSSIKSQNDDQIFNFTKVHFLEMTISIISLYIYFKYKLNTSILLQLKAKGARQLKGYKTVF